MKGTIDIIRVTPEVSFGVSIAKLGNVCSEFYLPPSRNDAPLGPNDEYKGLASNGNKAPQVLREIAAEAKAEAVRVP